MKVQSVTKSEWLTTLMYAEAYGDAHVAFPERDEGSATARRQKDYWFLENVLAPLIGCARRILFFGTEFHDGSYGGAGSALRGLLSKCNKNTFELSPELGTDDRVRGFESFWLDADKNPTNRGAILLLLEKPCEKVQQVLTLSSRVTVVQNLNRVISAAAFRRAREWARLEPQHCAVYCHPRTTDWIEFFAQPSLVGEVLTAFRASTESGEQPFEWDYEPPLHFDTVMSEARADIARMSGKRLFPTTNKAQENGSE